MLHVKKILDIRLDKDNFIYYIGYYDVEIDGACPSRRKIYLDCINDDLWNWKGKVEKNSGKIEYPLYEKGKSDFRG